MMGWRDLPIGGVPPLTSLEYKTGDWKVFMPKIDTSKCTKCGLCWMYCPDSAIIWDGEGYPEPNYDYCKGCGICANECPVKAIEMVR
jgi:pyruvate ferredoxin oxidoreductase delta subunit